MSAALESLREQLRQAAAELSALQDCYLTLMTENAELREHNSELQQEVDELRGRIDELLRS